MQARYDARNPAALKRLVAQGAVLKPMPRPVMEAAFKASNDVYSDLAAKNQNWKKVYEDWTKFRADQVLWFRITEREFDNFMSAQRL
jgi:TRAP-type mannitol/chloroaromatic compound transport system substrate-binding protein